MTKILNKKNKRKAAIFLLCLILIFMFASYQQQAEAYVQALAVVGVDKQIRSLIEQEVRHRKLNNYGFGGLLISLTFKTWFIAISYWYGGNKLIIGKEIFAYSKKYENIYDSYKLFSSMVTTMPNASGADGDGGNRLDGGAPGEVGPGAVAQPELDTKVPCSEYESKTPFWKKWHRRKKSEPTPSETPSETLQEPLIPDEAEQDEIMVRADALIRTFADAPMKLSL